MGWQKLGNGHLLKAADSEGFEILVTVDKQMRFQSSLKNLKIGVVVVDVDANSHTEIERALVELNRTLDQFEAGQFHVFRPSDSSND